MSAARWLFGFRIAISLEGPALRAHAEMHLIPYLTGFFPGTILTA
jgi:hypothetical protein